MKGLTRSLHQADSSCWSRALPGRGYQTWLQARGTPATVAVISSILYAVCTPATVAVISSSLYAVCTPSTVAVFSSSLYAVCTPATVAVISSILYAVCTPSTVAVFSSSLYALCTVNSGSVQLKPVCSVYCQQLKPVLCSAAPRRTQRHVSSY